VDKSVISRQLKDLRERGLVETTPSAEDARVSLVTPTKLAVEKAGAIAEQAKNRYTDFLDTWSSEDLAEFARLLERFSHITDFQRASAGSGPICTTKEPTE
jgi:DNA-binding MarR family transcriptional regulator